MAKKNSKRDVFTILMLLVLATCVLGLTFLYINLSDKVNSLTSVVELNYQYYQGSSGDITTWDERVDE